MLALFLVIFSPISNHRVAGAPAVPFNGCHLPINISMSSLLGAPGSTVDKVSQEKIEGR